MSKRTIHLTSQRLDTLMSSIEKPECPDEPALLDYACDELPAREHARIGTHLAQCASCQDEVAEWRAQLDALFDSRHEPTPELQAFQQRMLRALGQVGGEPAASAMLTARPADRRWRRAVLMEGAAIAALLLVVAYLGGRVHERDSVAETRLVVLQSAALVRAAMLENLRLLNDWSGTAGRTAGDSQAIAASLRSFELVQLPRAAGGVYALPTVLRVDGEVSDLGATVDRDPALRAEVVDYTRRFSDLLLPLSEMLVDAGRVTQARTLFEWLRQQYPDDQSYWLADAEMRKLDRDHAGAIALYEEMIQRGMATSDPRPYHYAGYSSFVLGNFQEALEYYDRALAIDQGYAKVYYNKALLYQQLPGLTAVDRARLYETNMRQALAATERAYAVEGDANPRITFTLAILHAVRDNAIGRDRALQFLERAMQWARAYVPRAEAEPAFAFFRDPRNEPYHTRFQDLLERYRIRSSAFGAREQPYDPSVFVE